MREILSAYDLNANKGLCWGQSQELGTQSRSSRGWQESHYLGLDYNLPAFAEHWSQKPEMGIDPQYCTVVWRGGEGWVS